MIDSGLTQFLGQAQRLLGAGGVKTALGELEPYCIDWRRRFFGKAAAAFFLNQQHN